MAPAVADLFARRRLVMVAGPCVVEAEQTCLQIGRFAAETCARFGLGYIFKASFDKANRTAHNAQRGPGTKAALAILQRLKERLQVPVLTDIHLPQQADEAAEVADVLQVPAFLCRQTDLLIAAAATGRPVNVKKGQFLAPEDMRHVVGKIRAHSADAAVAVTERGSCFGYHNLVVDMRSLPLMRQQLNCPVIFDATHSVQRPGGGDGKSSGERHLAPVLARAAVAVGIDGLFCELHPTPDAALSDGPNSLDYPLFEQVCVQARALSDALGPPPPVTVAQG